MPASNPFDGATPADLARMVRDGSLSDRETDALAACVFRDDWVGLDDDGWWKWWNILGGEDYWGRWDELPWITDPDADYGGWNLCGPLLVEYRLYIDWGYYGECEISNLDDSICVWHLNPCRAITDAALLVELGKWVAKGEGQ